MKFSNKQIVSFYFTATKNNKQICKCGTVRSPMKNGGYSNFMAHIKTEHPNYLNEIAAAVKFKNTTVTPVNTASKNLYGWLIQVVMENLEFSYVEKAYTRQYSNLKPITRKTLMKYLTLVTKEVEGIIRKMLPNQFGLIFDGWTDNGKHFMAIFACYSAGSATERRLLAFSPLDDETDLSADSMRLLFEHTLSFYERDVSNVLFVTDDNCSTTKALARKMGLPLIGCASHRLNLAVKLLYQPHEDILAKVNSLMKKLRDE